MAAKEKRNISVRGMHCGHCVEAVREALEAIDGVTVRNVEIGTAELKYNPDHITEDRLAAALEEVGYELEA